MPDRSKYRFPPYWWPDTALPGLATERDERLAELTAALRPAVAEMQVTEEAHRA